MNVSDELKAVENALRNIIYNILFDIYGNDWLHKCGVKHEKLDKWEERRLEELRTLGTCEDRLIYYSDFYDIKAIFQKNWGRGFNTIFGKLKKMEVLLSLLEKYRNSDAHRRELLPFQENLVIGISGEIRSQIIKFRSKMETPEDYFPRIESVTDSLGNRWTPSNQKSIITNQVVRVGDTIEFIINAYDPEGLKLEYLVQPNGSWTDNNKIVYQLTNANIGKKSQISALIKSPRDYRAVAGNEADDWITFIYTVLPQKTI